MKILVTGHKGFIGGNIFNYLKNTQNEVYGYDLEDTIPDVKFDFIIHMAARGLIRKSVEHPYEYFDDGLNLTVKMLELARKSKASFIFPSSGSTAKPTNPYSLAKKNAVEWIDLYGELYGIESYILKFFNIYGENARKGAVYLFTRAAITGETATVYGDGKHVRDFVYVGDVVKFIDDILKGRVRPGDYEIGTGKGTSVIELIDKIEKITGNKINYKNEDYIVNEADNLVARNPAIKNITPLEDGIKRVLNFIKNDKI
ncbi:NAD-dependent epimerase/dehydratase family protein [Caldiplasma sukawensis]